MDIAHVVARIIMANIAQKRCVLVPMQVWHVLSWHGLSSLTSSWVKSSLVSSSSSPLNDSLPPAEKSEAEDDDRVRTSYFIMKALGEGKGNGPNTYAED